MVRSAFTAPGIVVVLSAALFLGCGNHSETTSAQSAAKSPRKAASVAIGAILPLSGEMAKYGKTSLAALELAIEDVNRAGGAAVFRLASEDDHLTPSAGVAAARKLLDADHARFIVGAWPSSVTAAVIPVTDAAGAVLVSPASTAPDLSSPKNLFFRTCPSDLAEGTAAAEYASGHLHAKKAAILYIRNDFGQGLRKVFSDSFAKSGGSVAVSEGFDLGTSDFRVLLAKVAAAAPDVTYVVAYREMVPLLQQARELRMGTRWVATTMLNDPDMVKQAGSAADGVVFPSLDFDPDRQNPAFQDFRKRVQAKTGGLDVDVFAANAYDAVTMLAGAIRTSGSAPADVAKYLHSPRTYSGTWGAYSLDAKGSAVRGVVYKRITAGRITPDTQ